MSDLFFRLVRELGRPAFVVSSTPVAIGVEHIPRRGPCLIASNHGSPYDVPLLMRHVPRVIDFVSITEVFRNPFVRWFYGSMGALPLDRSRRDAATLRAVVKRLTQGRLVVMFPEGGFRRGGESVVHTRRIRPGVGRLAKLGGAPVIPAVVVNSRAYSRPASWLPIQRTRYGVAFGAPIPCELDAAEIEARLVDALADLYSRLAPLLPSDCREV